MYSHAIDEKEGWEARAKSTDELYDRIDEGARRFTHEWLQNERDLKETSRLKTERVAAEGQALAKRGRTDGGDKRDEGYGGPKGQRGGEVEVARQKKQPKAKLRGGRIGKPVGYKSRSGVAAVTDVGQQELFTAVPVTGGMSATEESKREQADLVARHVCD